MTLDICRLLFNVINKQMKIQHNARTAGVYKPDQIPEDVKAKILSKYGEDFLGDANILVFFRGLEDKKSVQKLFKTLDNALGNDANLLVVGDFKKLSMNDNGKAVKSDDDSEMSDEAKIQNDVDEVLKEDDDDNDDDDDDSEDSDDKSEDSEDSDDDSEDSESSDDSDDSDDDSSETSEPAADGAEQDNTEQEREVPGEYVFIKITVKD